MHTSLNDASTIKSWMTFSYVNRSFALPDIYLKRELAITDPNYPNITIRKAAKELSKNEAEFLQEVIESVTNVFTFKKLP